MNRIYTLLSLFFILQSCTQTKTDYLRDNSFDLSSKDFDFPQKDFKIIGFGAYHGSAKTEDVELSLIHSLTKTGAFKYYFPEVDYSKAYFYNKYLQTGDTLLLKDLIIHNGFHVPQERTIEAYEKWKKMKKINDELPVENEIKILGLDLMKNYKYVSKHILELVNGDAQAEIKTVREIREMVETDTTYFTMGKSSIAYEKLQHLVIDFEKNKTLYSSNVGNMEAFEHLMNNLKASFEENQEREKTIYDNYVALDAIHNFKNNSQFVRMGFFHIEKSREGKEGYPSFFTRLIENGIYDKEEVLSIIGYLTKSKVVWEETYDNEGNYSGFTTEAGFGIGDYEKEYFRGIQHLKDAKLSDETLFRLNLPKTPYAINEPDLIDVVMQDEASNSEAVKGMSTLDFLDYAVLISDSKASTPIYEMK